MFKFIKDPYYQLFLHFIYLEIPSILQIVTIFGFLSFLLENIIFRLLISAVVSELLVMYLFSRLDVFLLDQAINKYSIFNRKGMKPRVLMKKWSPYLYTSAILISLIISFLPVILLLGN